MTLKPEQVTELNAASERVTSGLGTPTDKANLDYAAKSGYKYTPPTINPSSPIKTDTTALASAVENVGKTDFELGKGIGGYDAALKAEATPVVPTGEVATDETTGTEWMADWMKSAFGTGETAKVEAPTFTAEKTRLEQAKTSRIAALDATYATDLARTQKNNQNVGNALKARLLKLGVSPTDSAWSNAEAGQLERDQAAESKLRNEYLSNKAAIEADLDSKITTVAMNEATMAFNATVKNIENKLQTQAQGINLYQIFSQRDQAEKDREQKAYGDMLQYQGTMASLDQKQQEAIAKNFIENAQNGLYNISDKATLEMLTKMEKESPYLTGLTNIAVSGLSDRLDKKALDAANLAKIKSDTAQNYAQINKLKSDSGSDKELKSFYTDIENQLGLLSSGKTDWATAYKTIKTKNPVADATQGAEQDKLIDSLLNKNVWSQPGAYEAIQTTRAKSQPTITIGAPDTNGDGQPG